MPEIGHLPLRGLFEAGENFLFEMGEVPVQMAVYGEERLGKRWISSR